MAFTRIDTQLDGPVLLEPAVFADERGFFAESFRESELAEHGITDHWVQDNHSRSTRGTIRGLHFQIGEGVAKLVRCGRGRIVDVLVDLRRSSPGYGRWEAYELDDEKLRVLYVPIGFAHGFAVLSDVADVLYKQTAYYSGDVERGIAYDDPRVGVSWPIPSALRVVSERDRTAPSLTEFEPHLPDW